MSESLLYNVYFKTRSERKWACGPGQMIYEEALAMENYYIEEGYETYVMAILEAFGEGTYDA